ncbi:phage tail spike protein [Macrococcus animalis]|uniref:phage tail spike protein n=1 Tax=Macrococcus animalis TaxID=3395467 RepID=UPI0039BDF15A
MYKVEIYQDDGSNKQTILDLNNKLSHVLSASLDKQEHSIDALTIDLMHAFVKANDYKIKPYKTLATVRDLKKNKLIFKGRVLAPDSQMSESGAFSHNLVFEGAEAFLKDTIQKYSFEFDKEPRFNLELVINHHNAELPNEPYKHFQIGTVTVEKNVIPNDGGYHEEEMYFKRWEDKDTYQTLHDDLKGKYGGTFIFEVTDGPTIVHWLKETGVKKNTVIKIAKNLKSIQYKVDPTEIITRLKPLGASSETANGDEIRLTIADVNGGSPYIDIPDLIAVYGIQAGTIDFDAYAPITLKEQAQKWITEQYQKLAKISISLNALDLSLIGIDTDEYDLFNIHRVECPPLKIDEDLKIVGLGLDLITPHNKSITIGEKQLTIAELQLRENIKVTNTIINNTVPGMIGEQVEVLKEDIANSESNAVIEADELARQRVEQFIKDSYEPFKLSIPNLMDEELSSFKQGELGTIINNTITTNGELIKNDVVNRINSGTNVIKGDAIVVDSAMVGKIATNQTFTDKLVANEAYVKNLLALQAVIDRIKSTQIDVNQLNLSAIASGTGSIPGAITITRPDGAKSVLNGMQQFGLSIWRYHPRFVNADVSIDGVFFKTQATTLVTFDAFALKHDSRYLNVNLECRMAGSETVSGVIAVEGFSGTDIYQTILVKGTTPGPYNFVIDLGVPTGGLKYFYLRFRTANSSNSILAREIIIYQDK